MSSTFIIRLNNLRLTAPHGVFEEEALTGNSFEVNLALTVAAPKNILTSIEETIDYGEAFNIVKAVFSVRKQLLETIAMEIAEALKHRFPSIRKVSIQIQKFSPPMATFNGSVSVTYAKKYKKSGEV